MKYNKPRVAVRPKSEQELTASMISWKCKDPWYVCGRFGSQDVVLSKENLKRFLYMGFEIKCAYYKGNRYSNIYEADGKLEFVV